MIRTGCCVLGGDGSRDGTFVIDAIDEALIHDPYRHHNLPPPVLRIENVAYLEELRKLRQELVKLNRARRTKTRDELSHGLAFYADIYMTHTAKHLALATRLLLLGSIAAILFHAGVSDHLIEELVKHVTGR